jgi:sirohydrochlorin ferrochelatase
MTEITDDRAVLYKKVVGVDPRVRMLTPEQVEEGIRDPYSERERLAAEDREDDRLDREQIYRGRFRSR